MSKRDLLACYEKLNEKHEFQPGDIVEWKRGLKNRRPDGPFIVCEVLDEPVFGKTDESGSTYFREPLDVILGIIESDGDFFVHHYDSRRMQLAD